MLGFGIINVSAATYGDFTYIISNNEAIITDCNDYATNVIIPSEINGYEVTSIDEGAFFDHDRLKSVVIPDSVITIGNIAFVDCSYLSKVTIGSGVKYIGDSAFGLCENLEGVHIKDVGAWAEIYFSNTGSNPIYYSRNLYINHILHLIYKNLLIN